MKTAATYILTLNGGSSSIKFALFEANAHTRILNGSIDRIGLEGTHLRVDEAPGKPPNTIQMNRGDFHDAAQFLLDWLASQKEFPAVTIVGHRVVHGLKRSVPERMTPALLDELRHLTPYDPDHLPLEILLIETISQRFPKLIQVACFDTAFHRTMPRVARMLPIPRRYEAKGVERYGFHGLSYASLMEELARQKEPAASKGRMILAHLGNGASLCAVRDGKSIDTSMGFTPGSGFMMSTRSGDLDPGLIHYLASEEGLTLAQLHKMATKESGLLGISETTSDIRDLLAAEAGDIRAAEAINLFCYQVKKWIGAFTAALGGLDALVFTGGIGENSSVIRERICEGLDFLDIRLNQQRNAKNSPLVSDEGSRVNVRVLHSDEERMIAHACLALLDTHE